MELLRRHLEPEEMEELLLLSKNSGWPIFLRLFRVLGQEATQALLDCDSHETYKFKQGYAKGVLLIEEVARGIHDNPVEIEDDAAEPSYGRPEPSASGPSY
jgi:hypothetical protein